MSEPSRRPSGAGRRNQEIDAIDLVAGLDALPAAADPTFSPLANIGRPVADPEPSPGTAPGDGPEPPASTAGGVPSNRPGGRRRSGRPSQLTSLAGGRTGPDSDIEQQRLQRDDKRARLIREALEARGLDPDLYTVQRLPKGGKHRPTIELSPDDYAAITIATTLHPELFGSTLVSFIRSCARHWEEIAVALAADRNPTSG